MRERCLRVAICLILATTVLGDVSPDVYKELQRNAPDALYIQVVSIDVHRSFAKPAGCSFFDFEVNRNVKVRARVVRVIRSATGVHPKDVIRSSIHRSADARTGTARDRFSCCGKVISCTRFSRDEAAPLRSIRRRAAQRFRRPSDLQLPSRRPVQQTIRFLRRPSTVAIR